MSLQELAVALVANHTSLRSAGGRPGVAEVGRLQTLLAELERRRQASCRGMPAALEPGQRGQCGGQAAGGGESALDQLRRSNKGTSLDGLDGVQQPAGRHTDGIVASKERRLAQLKQQLARKRAASAPAAEEMAQKAAAEAAAEMADRAAAEAAAADAGAAHLTEQSDSPSALPFIDAGIAGGSWGPEQQNFFNDEISKVAHEKAWASTAEQYEVSYAVRGPPPLALAASPGSSSSFTTEAAPQCAWAAPGVAEEERMRAQAERRAHNMHLHSIQPLPSERAVQNSANPLLLEAGQGPHQFYDTTPASASSAAPLPDSSAAALDPAAAGVASGQQCCGDTMECDEAGASEDWIIFMDEDDYDNSSPPMQS